MRPLLAFLLLIAPAAAEGLGDAVPGHEGVTYGDLMKQVIPDLAPQDDGSWKGRQVPELNDLSGKPDQNDFSDGFAFTSVEVLKARENGRSRLLLITTGSASDSFAEILAAFDDEEAMPKLLDAVDAGSDRFTGFGETLPLSDASDLFLVENSHSNSDQSYRDIAALFLMDSKFRFAAGASVFGERLCSHEMSETAQFKTVADGHAKVRALSVRVTQETTLSDLDCGEAERPKPLRRVWRDVFHWDAAKGAFVSKTDNLGRLAKENEERF